MAKQNETQSKDLSVGSRNHTRKLQERRSRSKSNRISKGVRRDSEPSCMVYHIRQRWNRFYPLIIVIILKPECAEVNQLESLVKKVQGCILLLIVLMFSKQELQCIKRHVIQ